MTLYQKLHKGMWGAVNNYTLIKQYHRRLPLELEQWYVYTLDGGHNIFVLLKQFENELLNDITKSYQDFMIPCPVKTVTRKYQINKDGIIVIDTIKYRDMYGALVDYNDFEY